MTKFDASHYTGGWIIGGFAKAILKTDKFEVSYKKLQRGEKGDGHWHKSSVEFNLVAHGAALVNGETIITGQGWVYYPLERSEVEFLEDTDLVVIRIPSINDKLCDTGGHTP
jgi:hypothetical protein